MTVAETTDNIMTQQDLIHHAKQQEQAVREVLEELHYALVELDSENEETGTSTSFYMDFDTQDMFHAASILYSVCSNYAMKHGILTDDNVTEKISKFRNMLKETFGLDTIVEAQVSVLMNKIKAEA